MNIEIRQDDPLTYEGGGFVVPTNSYAQMVEGWAARIKEVGGEAIESEAMKSAPIAVGAAISTSAGSLLLTRLIHVPFSEHPGVRIGIENGTCINQIGRAHV